LAKTTCKDILVSQPPLAIHCRHHDLANNDFIAFYASSFINPASTRWGARKRCHASELRSEVTFNLLKDMERKALPLLVIERQKDLDERLHREDKSFWKPLGVSRI
jgi:hypothetical protein